MTTHQAMLVPFTSKNLRPCREYEIDSTPELKQGQNYFSSGFIQQSYRGETSWAFRRKIPTNAFGANLAHPAQSRFSIAADTSEPGSALPWRPREELDVQTVLQVKQEAGDPYWSSAVVKNLPQRKLHLHS